MYFLGLWHEDFVYRLYDSIEKKLIRSRDVVFLEDQTIKDIDKDDKPRSLDDILVGSDPDLIPVLVAFDHGGVETDQREDIVRYDTATNEIEQEGTANSTTTTR